MQLATAYTGHRAEGIQGATDSGARDRVHSAYLLRAAEDVGPGQLCKLGIAPRLALCVIALVLRPVTSSLSAASTECLPR